MQIIGCGRIAWPSTRRVLLLGAAAIGLAGCSVGVDRPGFSAGMGTFAERFELRQSAPEVICPPPEIARDMPSLDPACVRAEAPARPAQRGARTRPAPAPQ